MRWLLKTSEPSKCSIASTLPSLIDFVYDFALLFCLRASKIWSLYCGSLVALRSGGGRSL